MSLDGDARDAILELPGETISSETGLDEVLKRLDELYLKDETLQKYELFDQFDNYKRAHSVSINEFLHQFNLLYNKLKSYGTTISDDLLAYKLFKSGNLSPDHEKLAKATCELKYNSMKEQLKKIFLYTKTSHIPSIPSLKVDEINQSSTVTHHQLITSGHDISNNCVQHGVHDNGDDYCAETFYTRSPNNRPYNNRSTTRYQQQSQNNGGNRRPSFSPQYNQKKVTFEKKGRNL